jgi:hypothetical protein
VADDFDLAHFRHLAKVFSFRLAEQFGSVDLGNIKRRQLPRSFSGRRLFENQALVLADVAGGFAGHVF